MLFYNFQNVKVEGFMQMKVWCVHLKRNDFPNILALSWRISQNFIEQPRSDPFASLQNEKYQKSLEKQYKQAFLRHVFPARTKFLPQKYVLIFAEEASLAIRVH